MPIISFLINRLSPSRQKLNKILSNEKKFRNDIKTQLAALGKNSTIINGSLQELQRLETIENAIAAINNKQKEMVLQLDEIDAALNDGSDELIATTMAVSDNIFDFYCCVKNDMDLFSQAKMMWENTKKNLSAAKIAVIEPAGETYNDNLHTAYGVVSDSGMPHGYVSQTLKCGYIHNNKIVRRATVLVNRLSQEGLNNE